jgi:lysozyme family protein
MLGYSKMWDLAIVYPAAMEQAKARMNVALAHEDLYERVKDDIHVPLLFVMPVHEREASLRFNTHLHNGDPLTARTKHVPAGRPKTGTPPFKWDESAADALTMQKLDKVQNWSIERILYEQHRYNGITKYPSSYVFGGTQFYTSGMWVADHVYDASVLDKRPGTLAMMKALITLDPALGNFSREPVAPKDVHDEAKDKATKGAKVVRNTAGGAGGAATGTEIAAKPATTVQGIPILQVGIGVCAAVFTIAAIYVVVKNNLVSKEINKLWSGE